MSAEGEKQVCTICRHEFIPAETAASPFTEAGEWLAEEIWGDQGELCPACLENRGKLAMMYCHECSR